MMTIFNLEFLQLMIMAFMSGWLISNFEPLQNFIQRLKRKYFGVIIKVLSCHKCSSLWSGIIIGLYFELSPFVIVFASIGASMLGFLWDNYLNGIKL